MPKCFGICFVSKLGTRGLIPPLFISLYLNKSRLSMVRPIDRCTISRGHLPNHRTDVQILELLLP